MTLTNSKGSSVEISLHFWAWLLRAGMGLPIGVGIIGQHAGMGELAIIPENIRRGDPTSADPFVISTEEARMMAHLGRTILLLEKVKEERKKEEPGVSELIVSEPVNQDWQEEMPKLFDWMEASDGFTSCQ